MRRLVPVLIIFVSCALLCRADTLQVDTWGLFLPSQYCTSDCNQLWVHVNFQWDPNAPFSFEHDGVPLIPGTLHVQTSGFLGSFSSGDEYLHPGLGLELRLVNRLGGVLLGDELDLVMGDAAVNYMYFYSCASALCRNAFLPPGEERLFVYPSYFSSTAVPVNVAEPASLALLMSGLLGLAIFKCRRVRRKLVVTAVPKS